jgi:hypothetical protein
MTLEDGQTERLGHSGLSVYSQKKGYSKKART